VSRSKSLVLVAFLALSALAAAGCVSPGGSLTTSSAANAATDVSWALKALPANSATHDHRNWADHQNLSTPNFQELAYEPLATSAYGNKTAGGYFCGGAATTKDGHKLAVISSYDTDVAFVLVDVTDPLHPQKVGEYSIAGTTHYDVDITPDGKHVLIGSDPSLNPRVPKPITELPLGTGTNTIRIDFTDACTGRTIQGPEEQIPLAPGTIMVNVANPKSPQFEDFVPAPVLGPHSVSTAILNNVTYATASTTNLAHPGSYFQFFQIVDLPTGMSHLQLLSMVDSAQYGKQAAVNGHIDAELEIHPVTHKMVAYLSDWDGGLIILDMSNPEVPMLLSEWSDSGPDAGAVHSTRSIDGTWDGKHYLLVGQEFTHHPSNRPSGWVYILDDTDPAHPKEAGRWTLPVDVQANWGGVELFSTHYFRVQDRTAFVAMYHGGVWAIDLSTPKKLASPPSVGVFVPDKAPPNPNRQAKGVYDYAPFVLDVFPFDNGDLGVFDGLSGFYSLHYDASKPMPSPTPWPKDGKSPG
jgi:hypothetical protein